MSETDRAKRVAWFSNASGTIRLARRDAPGEQFEDEDSPGMRYNLGNLRYVGLRVLEEFPPPPIEDQLRAAEVVHFLNADGEGRVAIRVAPNAWRGYVEGHSWDSEWVALLVRAGSALRVLKRREP